MPTNLTEAQLRAVVSRDPLHVVSAGAGSGKTRVLVERVYTLAQEGVLPDRILVITFTEKAAAELKQRIVSRFEREGMQRERRAAESAYISTIHGFCARIVREWPLAAALDPAFGIIDPVDEALFYEERLDALWGDPDFAKLAREYGTPYGETGPTLFKFIKQLIAAWREQGKTVNQLDADADVDALALRAIQASSETRAERWREMLTLLRGADKLTTAADVGGESGKKYQALCDCLATLDLATPRWELAQELWENIGFYARSRRPDKESWKARLEPPRGIADSMRKRDLTSDDLLDRESARRSAHVMRWAASVWRAFDTYKRDRHLLDFQDLQHSAIGLLERAPRALAQYRERFRHILLDEAQDTNPLQYRLLRLLWSGDNAWFVVGDPKQAIYGFRSADPALFSTLLDEAGHSRRTELAANFRSRSAILNAVNAAGRALWGGSKQSSKQAGFFELTPALPYPTDGDSPRIELCVVEQRPTPDAQRDTESMDEARDREARWIAARLSQLKSDRFQIWTEGGASGSGHYRDFDWGDAAILLRTGASDAFVRAFRDAGIPAAVVGGSGFFEGLEVQDLLNGLSVVLNRRDEVALLAALRSPLCGVDDDTLLAIRRAQDTGRQRTAAAAGKGEQRDTGDTKYVRLSFWRAIQRVATDAETDIDTRNRIKRFLRTIRYLRTIRDAASASELLGMLIARTDYRAKLFASHHARARAANVAKLEKFARAHDAKSLRDFLSYARRAARHLSDSPDAPLAEPGDPVVTICTVHRSKGLEWPVVFLADLAREYWRTAEHSGVTHDGTLILSVPLDPNATNKQWQRPLGAMAAIGAINAEAAAEGERLLYVAMTRSREMLILTGVAKDGSASSDILRSPIAWFRYQLGLGPAVSLGEQNVSWNGMNVRISCVDRATPDPRPVPTHMPKSLEALYHHRLHDGALLGDGVVLADLTWRMNGVSIPQRAAEQLSVTRLAGFLRCELVYRYSELGLEEYPTRPLDVSSDSVIDGHTRALVGAPFGDALHRALERADFHADPVQEGERLANLAGFGDDERERAQTLIQTALRTSVSDEIRRAGDRVRREVPFYVPLSNGTGTTVLHGIIDLIFQSEDGAWHIVDWKSNAIKDERRMQTLIQQYTPQVQLYAAALRSVQEFGHIGSGRLVFLQTGRVERIPVDNIALEKTLGRAATAALRIGQGEYNTTPGDKCIECGYRRGKWCALGVEYVAERQV